jgi:hypothetical protein
VHREQSLSSTTIQTLATSRNAKRTPETIASVLMVAAAAGVAYRGIQYYAGGGARHHLETAWIWLIAAAVLSILMRRSTPAEDGSRPEASREASPPSRLTLASIAIPSALLLYLPALRVGFLSDDFVLLARAARNDFFMGWSELLRPVPLLIFRMVGPHPVVLHAFNIVLHGFNAALVVRLGLRYSNLAAAAAAGAFFLAFPANVEPVVWCSGIQDVLMTTLVLLTIDGAATFAPSSLVALAAALLTKETAVAAPALLAVVPPRRHARTAAAAALVLVYVAWRVIIRPVPDSYAIRPSAYVLKELASRAFATLAVPLHTSLISDQPWIGVAITVAFVVLVISVVWRGSADRAHLRHAMALTVWILASVAPVYSYFFVTGDLAGSRYLYLPAVGWAILIPLLLTETRSRPANAVAAIVCVLCVAATRANTRPWLAAAAARDQVLAAVHEAQRAGCQSVWAVAPPDSVEGAYVFRNGLAEAIAPLVLDRSARPGCSVQAGR